MKPLLAVCLFLCLAGYAPLYAQSAGEAADRARFVWVDTDTSEVFQVAYFRRDVRVEGGVTEALLHLFADSRYLLSVNGQTVNFGPARFYPDHPTYDTYDLAPYLRPGRNVIGLRVLSNGAATFQLRRHRPGFIAWGRVLSGRGSATDLTTTGQNWTARRAGGYGADTPKVTFALGPMEVHDAREEAGYLNWSTDTLRPPAWPHPVVVPGDGWGELSPRSIPYLTQDEFLPWMMLGRAPFDTAHRFLAAQLSGRDRSWSDYRKSRSTEVYTYLKAPASGLMSVAVSPGEYRLNGAEVEATLPERGLERQQRTLRLQLDEGWNRLDGRLESSFGATPFYLAYPDSLSLEVSPDRREADDRWFTWSGSDEGPAASNPALDQVWQPLVKSPLAPLPYRDTVRLAAGIDEALAFDFRHKRLGRIVVDYEAPAGTVFDIGFAEDTGEDGWPYLMKRHGLYMGVRHVAAGGRGHFETIRPYGLRYLQVNVHEHAGPVTVNRVSVVNQVYPFEENGSFACSDPLLNDIWQLGWRSLRVCAEDSYTDTPFRERGLYAGDMIPQMAITLTNDTDLRLVRRSLELFQDMYADLFEAGGERHPDEISLLEDYPLLTLEALSWYTARTDDTAFLRRVYPAYDYYLRQTLAKRGPDGLVPNERVFIEWTKLQKNNVTNTAYQAILYNNLRNFSRLSRRLGRTVEESFYADAAVALGRSIEQHLYRPELGRYSDGLQEGRPLEETYPISSAWPYLAGLRGGRDTDSLINYIAEQLADIGTEARGKRVTPYGSFYVLTALLEAGRTEAVETFIRKHWSPMVYKRNDTAWENFDDTGLGTLSHAWSGAPTYLLSAYTLGVKLGWPEPVAMDTLSIEPQAATISWAEGTVPHPAGPVHVRWEKKADCLWVAVRAPDGLPVRVRPRGPLADLPLFVNGELQQ